MPAALLKDPKHRPVRTAPNGLWRVTGAVVLTHVGVAWAIGSSALTPMLPTATKEQVIMASVVMIMPPTPNAQTQTAPPKALHQPKSRPKPQHNLPPNLPPNPPSDWLSDWPTKPQIVSPVSPTIHPSPSRLKEADSTLRTLDAPRQAASQSPVLPMSEAVLLTALTDPVAAGHPSFGATAAVSATAKVVQPSSTADYLNNPPPLYPRVSKRLGEQGTVDIGVLINAEGRAEKTEIRTSSGYPRLDNTALSAVQAWRFVPGQRNGVAEAMWFTVPIRFVLD